MRATPREERAGGKEGVATGAFCRHPLTGARLPIYVANFVLMEYGTGAVMAVPAHDQRDFEFARAYDLPARVVIQPEDERLDASGMTVAWEGLGRLVDSEGFSGLPNETAKERIAAMLAERGLGGPTVTYRLRDWGISRQRYWGAPIPVIYCERCGAVPVPDAELPVDHDCGAVVTDVNGLTFAQKNFTAVYRGGDANAQIHKNSFTAAEIFVQSCGQRIAFENRFTGFFAVIL